jgi:O-methyltransferase
MSLAGSVSDPSSVDPNSPSVAAVRLLQIIENEFRDGLQKARPAKATGPRPDRDSVRTAYLDLLKLCLCDLVGTSTASVARTREGLVMSRELVGEQLRLRAAGMDWPLHGLTMVGLKRLDDLQACIESVVRDGVPGDLMEAGSWRGGASLFMRATLDTLEQSDRTVWVADSFQGFPKPEVEADGYDLSADLAGCDFLAVPLEEVKDTFARLGCERGVRFVPGFFQDTLPALAGGRWSVIRLDGDTYDSVRIAMESLYPGLSPGGYLIVDDYASLDQCRAATDDFRSEHGITEPIEEVDWSCVRWRRRDEGPTSAQPPAAHAASERAFAHPVPRPPRTRVPAIEEVELGEEIERLRRRVSDAEAEIEQLLSSPVAGPRAWFDRRRAARRSAS